MCVSTCIYGIERFSLVIHSIQRLQPWRVESGMRVDVFTFRTMVVAALYLCHQSFEFYCQTDNQTKYVVVRILFCRPFSPFYAGICNAYACMSRIRQLIDVFSICVCLRFSMQCSTFVKFTLELRKLLCVECVGGS